RLGLLLAMASVVVAGALLFRSARKTSGSADFPDGMHWLCTSCNHGFTTSRDDFAEWLKLNPGQQIGCPKCKGHNTAVAKRCPLPKCGRYYVERNLVIDGKVSCPLCKKPLP
ncbi:MAG: hypothetical protein NT154_20205, partial [Verrucomicrobia bacterium]|nr:hypothetical protein [Verrucomicrobiota bacterium]